MSYEAQAWARKIRCGTPIKKAVLMMLAYHANEDGESWPGIEYLAETVDCTGRAVQKALRSLQEMGLLETAPRQHKEGASRSNLYRLKMNGDGQKSVDSALESELGEGELCSPPSGSKGEQGSPSRVNGVQGEGEHRSPLDSSIDKSITPFTPQVSKTVTDDDRKAARWMAGRVQALFPKAKPPNIEAWANDVRLIRTQDRHELQEICKVFDWANKDTRFWQRVILSPRNLRKHYTRLFLEANVFQKPDAERPKCLHCPNVASITVGHRHYCSDHTNLIER